MPPKTPLDIWNDALALAGKVVTGTATEEDVNSFREKYQTPETVKEEQPQQQYVAETPQPSSTSKEQQEDKRIPALEKPGQNLVEGGVEDIGTNKDVDQSTPITPESNPVTMKSDKPVQEDKKEEQDENNDLAPKVEKQSDPLTEMKQRLQDEQNKEYDFESGIEKLLLLDRYGQAGVSPNDPMVQSELETSSPSSMAKDIARRFTDGEGNIKENPLEWNFLGANSQNKTTGAAKDIYEYLFSQDTTDGNSDARSPWRQLNSSEYDRYNPFTGDWIVDPLTNQLVHDRSTMKPLVDTEIVDDGQSVASRESAFMTGKQYLKYLGAGLPGRDADDIDPSKIYNKQDEMENYGFIPYITSDESLDKFHETTAPHSIANYFNDLADFRRDITDHKLNVGGESFSGKDFDKNFSLWNQKLESNPNGHKLIDHDPGEFDIPQTPVMYDTQGNRYVAPNEPIDYQQRDDGSIVIKFNDNPDDDWVFDDQEDYDKSLRYETAKDGEFVIGWETGWDPLVLDSGQKIRADKALDINKNYSQYVDYGPGNIGKRNPEGILENPSDALPWFIDMALSSAPYFDTRTAAVQGIANTAANSQGIKPGRQGSDGTYNFVSEKPNFNEVASSTVGSAILPVTEHLWGPLGEHIFNGPTRAVLSHIPGIKNLNLESVPGRWFTGTSDEGVEEIFGNIVEELINSGQSGWYANDVMKQNPEGEWVVDYDKQGRAKKEDTNVIDRLRNFIFDAPEAYVGGAALGGILGSARIPEYMQENAEKKKEIEEVGYNRKNTDIDYDKLSETSALSEMERRRYDRGRQ